MEDMPVEEAKRNAKPQLKKLRLSDSEEEGEESKQQDMIFSTFCGE